MNRKLALKLVSKMQTNVWDLKLGQADIILSILENPNQQLSICDVVKPFYCWDEKALGKKSECKKQCDNCILYEKSRQ
jgi:hypothetical protein